MFSLFFIFILGLGVISASENISDSVIESEDFQDELNVDENIVLENEDSSNNLISSYNGGTFEDIQETVDNTPDGGTIELEGIFNSTGDEIKIGKNLTIKGNSNTVLDGKKLSGIFTFKGSNKFFLV